MRSKASSEDIDRVIIELKCLWEMNPQQRLGQLLLNLARDFEGQTNKHVLWNMDEQELLDAIDRVRNKGW